MSFLTRQKDLRLLVFKVGNSEGARRAWESRRRNAEARLAGAASTQAAPTTARRSKPKQLELFPQHGWEVVETKEARIARYDKELKQYMPGVATTTAATWDQVVPGGVSPKDLIKALTGQDKGDLRVSIDTFNRLHIEGNDVLMYGGAKAISLDRSFDFSSKNVHHGYLKYYREGQGKDSTKTMYQNVIPIYDKMGMKTVDTYANLEAGAYVWAKYGFEGRVSHMEALSDFMRGKLSAALSQNRASGYSMSPQAKKELAAVENSLKAARDNPNPHSNWSLADMKTPALDEYLASTDLFKNFKASFTTIKPTVAKTTSNNVSYNAVLNLGKDSVSRKRLDAYLTKPRDV